MASKKLITLKELCCYDENKRNKKTIPEGVIVEYIGTLTFYFTPFWIVKYKRTYCLASPKNFKEIENEK